MKSIRELVGTPKTQRKELTNITIKGVEVFDKMTGYTIPYSGKRLYGYLVVKYTVNGSFAFNGEPFIYVHPCDDDDVYELLSVVNPDTRIGAVHQEYFKKLGWKWIGFDLDSIKLA